MNNIVKSPLHVAMSRNCVGEIRLHVAKYGIIHNQKYTSLHAFVRIIIIVV